MRILASAEAFGYGPASKLIAVCSELNRHHAAVDFKGVGISFDFAKVNATTFDSIEQLDRMVDLAAVSSRGYDGALSVMDPFLALWAAFHEIPCIYIDSLYWFWTWPDECEPELQKRAAELLALGTVDEALAALADISMHEAQYLAHYLATKSCIQRPASRAQRGIMPGHAGVEYVDAVVDMSQRRPADPDGWLATTSGLLNPLVSTELAVSWVRSIFLLLLEGTAEAGEDAPIIIAGNPEVLALASEHASDRLEIKPLDHAGILSAMNSAIGCFAPPGLTTMLEASAYGTPLILLPEQHYGHFANYDLISQQGASNCFPQALMGTRIKVDQTSDMLAKTQALILGLAKHRTQRSRLWRNLVEAVAEGVTGIREDRAARASAQVSVIRRAVGGYAGTAQVCEHALALFGNCRSGDEARLRGENQ
jgi:hypothetical protein